MSKKTGLKTEAGKDICVGDLLFAVKNYRNGVVCEVPTKDKYVVVFNEKGGKYSCFALEKCLHLKHLGSIADSPDGWV